MKCPACEKELIQKEVGGVVVDICDGGCGGIWFDNYELKKFDEPHESAGEELLIIGRDPDIKVDPAEKRMCPKCDEMTMMKHFFSIKNKVELDECGQCGGIWLDFGELAAIRKLFNTEEERKKAASDYFDEVFGEELKAEMAKSEESFRRAQRIANVFRFICPTYYIPGSQSWGAF